MSFQCRRIGRSVDTESDGPCLIGIVTGDHNDTTVRVDESQQIIVAALSLDPMSTGHDVMADMLHDKILGRIGERFPVGSHDDKRVLRPAPTADAALVERGVPILIDIYPILEVVLHQFPSIIGKSIENTSLPIALSDVLKNYEIHSIHLHLDNDKAGKDTTDKIIYHLKDQYEVFDDKITGYKDVNEYLIKKCSKEKQQYVK